MMGTEFRTYDSKIHERVAALDLWAGAFRIRLVSALMFVILTILCLVLPALVRAEKAVSVQVRPFSQVVGKNMTAGDLVDIEGPESVRKRINDIHLGSSPMPGKQKRIPGSMIENKIRSRFPNKGQGMSIVVPGIIVVERKGQEITEPELQALFYTHISEKVEGRPFRLKDVKIRGNRVVPLGSRTLKVDERQNRNIKGRVTVTVRPEVDGEKASPIYLSGWVDLFDQVVTAQRDIPRGGTIKKEDIGLSKQNLSKSPPGLLTVPEKVEGTVARSRIEKGSYIRDTMVAEAPVVRKGDVVKIVASSGGLTVVAQGVAREDGRMGEQVMVENVRSNKNVPARVVGPGSVEVVF